MARKHFNRYGVETQDDKSGDGYNKKLIRFMREVAYKGPSYDTHDLVKLNELFDEYMDKCEKWDMKPGNQGMALALGVSYSTFKGWMNDPDEVKRDPARARVVREMCQFIATYRENLMIDARMNPVVGIFWQKNYDGMKDEQETVIKHETDSVDVKRLKDKYQAIAESGSNIIDVEATIKNAKTQIIDYRNPNRDGKKV